MKPEKKKRGIEENRKTHKKGLIFHSKKHNWNNLRTSSNKTFPMQIYKMKTHSSELSELC